MAIIFRICVSRSFIIKFSTATFVLLLSYFVMSSATGGDIYIYQTVYNDLPDYGIYDGFLFYYNWISSAEFGHYLLVWMASRLIDHNTFISFSNAILAYVAMSVFQKWKASFIISLFLVVSNFYFFVMYFSTERLKIGFILLALSFLYSDKLKSACSLAFLASVTHIQTIIVYISLIINHFYVLMVKLLRTGKTFKHIIAIPLLILPMLILREHIFSKFQAYYHETGLVDFIRIIIFFLLAFYYANNKLEVVLLFIPVFISVLLFGGDRVNFLGYFIFLFYGLQFRRGWNFGVVVTSIYFAYATIGFCINTLGVVIPPV